MTPAPIPTLRMPPLHDSLISKLFSKFASIIHLGERSRPVRFLSQFERLPTEVLLIIRDMLETPAQVVLGLTCKRLYNVVARELDPTLYTTKERINISKCFEIDLHTHLTCQICGTMFHWQRRARLSHSCPAIHPRNPEQFISPRSVSVAVRPSIAINLETINLIFRYYERGPQTGVSVGWLNHSGNNWAGIPQETRARWSCGQLVVYTQWTLDLDLLQASNGCGRLWRRFQTCCHDSFYWEQWNNMDALLEQTNIIQKCMFCACDAVINQEILEDGSLSFVVKSWCNYGNSQSEDPAIKQVLRPFSVWPTDQGVRAQRNLRDLFDRGEDETDEKEIKNTRKIRKKLEYEELLHPQSTCTIQ